jgi:hypothetical protein
MVERSPRFVAPANSEEILKMPRGTARRSMGRDRRGIAPVVLGIIVVVVAVVVVAGGLFAAGVFTPKSSGGGTSATFAVKFTETGLLLGGSWSVTLGGSTQSSSSSSIQFNVANGSYSYSVSAPRYTALPASGTLTVNGQPVSQAITLTPIPTYSVVFTESTLPSGTSWSVTLNGSTENSASSSITFTEPNGAYAYTVGTVSGYAASPSSGTLTVNGAAVSQAITFTTAVTYSVVFTETGLPVGVSWTVTLSGTPQSSTTSTITFSETNGNYAYTVAVVTGYSAAPTSGTLTVNGAGVSQTITFTSAVATTYAVTFTESGLTFGTTWSVTLNGSTQSSAAASIVFTEPNGTYSFAAGSVAGYTPAPSSGNVIVRGAVVSQAITYTSSGGGSQTAYSQAKPVAVAAANAQGSGWLPVVGLGESLTAAYTNTSHPAFNASCPFTGGPSSWPTFSPWTGTYANGETSYWFFFFYSSASSSLLFVLVSGSSATIMGTVSGSGCVSSFFSYFTGLGSGIIDSTAAATRIASNDSAYVAAHPSASASYILTSGLSFSGYSVSPEWDIHFTTCSPNGGGTGSNFTAFVNASSGKVTSSITTNGGACGSVGFSHAALSSLHVGPTPPWLSPDRLLLQREVGFLPPARYSLPTRT